MNKHLIGSVFAVSAALWLSAACTDDFSRFQFGQKNPRPRDAGTQNATDAAKNGAQDSGSTGTLVNMIGAGAKAGSPKLDAGP